MRQIIGLLMEYRLDDLSKRKAPNSKLQETREMFEWIDNSLNWVSPNSVDSRLEETMTSADFTNAVLTFVRRQMVGPYTETMFAFEPFVRPDTLVNYLPHQRHQDRAGVDDLEYVQAKAPARPGSVDDSVVKQYRVYQWKKQFDFDRQLLVNDDLGYFQTHAQKMGRAARRTLEKYVSRFMWNATTIARLVALGALYSTTGRLTTARISTARMGFNQRLDDRGEPINAALQYIVYHSGLADTVATIRASTLVPELATNAANVVQTNWTPIQDPHAAGTAPNLPWFALSDFRLNGIIPFVLARRSGMPAPILVRRKSDVEGMTSLLGSGVDMGPLMGDFATGNVQVMVWDEWGTYIDETEGNMFDARGCYYSSGTAP